LRIRDVVCLKRALVKGNRIVLRAHKNKKMVSIPLHPEIASALKELGGKGEYFFWSGLGTPKSAVSDWQRTLKRLGMVAGASARTDSGIRSSLNCSQREFRSRMSRRTVCVATTHQISGD
jgi:hypothetical protein